VPIAPINNLAEALEQPQAKHRNMLVESDHPVVGKYLMTGNPIKMGQQEFFEPAPTLGQHNLHILQELLGYPSEHIESLQNMGII
jgi:crotonobetainyl-CoA:carnitine CoA-transferase CaiB-like acyl-CoA transferase